MSENWVKALNLLSLMKEMERAITTSIIFDLLTQDGSYMFDWITIHSHFWFDYVPRIPRC